MVQLYLGSPAAAEEPPKQLKGFEKILLKPGERKVVTMKLNKDSLAAWDAENHRMEGLSRQLSPSWSAALRATSG